MDEDTVNLTAHVARRLRDDIEEPLFEGAVAGRVEPDRVLFPNEEFTPVVDAIRNVPEALMDELRQYFPAGPTNEVLPANKLLESGVGELEDLVRPPQDRDGCRCLHEERVQAFSLCLGIGSGDLFSPVELISFRGA